MSARTFWFGSMTKTARTVAVSEAPGCMRPYFCATFVSRSATTGKSILTPKCPSMFLIQAMCAGTESTERPMSCAPRSRNSSARRANSTNSVVQTGVKSAGCEKSTTHLPLKSESFNCPCVDLASKSGAVSLMRGKLLEVSCVAAVLITRLLFRVEVDRLTVLFVSTGGARVASLLKLRFAIFGLPQAYTNLAAFQLSADCWKVLRQDEARRGLTRAPELIRYSARLVAFRLSSRTGRNSLLAFVAEIS